MWPLNALRLRLGTAAVVALVGSAFVSTARAPLWSYAGVLLGALLLLLVSVRPSLRRRAWVRAGFPPRWREILEERVEFYRLLDAAARARFERDVLFFVREQRIYGAHGAEVDDETRVLVGASAAILGHGRPDFEWPRVRDIVVYPRTFDDEYRIERGHISGMVHAQGPIIFSKRDLEYGFKHPHDGQNVGLHELAHVMDFGSGYADGLPLGVSWGAEAPWVELVADRLQALRARRYRGVLSSYAATDEAEFFAVAVEVFFERPRRMRERDPELYRQLAAYFRQDPAAVADQRDDADEAPPAAP